MLEMIRMGYWMVLSYGAVHGHPHLKIAPCGVIPQCERRPRPIMDYTFNGVNQTSLNIAPTHAMQFGMALQCILQRLAYCNPHHGPPLMAKLDLADGYYRIPLSLQAALNLAVILPATHNTETLIALPLSLPMGWRDSPPYFCAFTETCTDLANIHPDTTLQHPFQYALASASTSHFSTFSSDDIFPFVPDHPQSPPLQYTDVYLDDFMIIAQQPLPWPAMNNLLSHIHSVFRDPDSSPRRKIVSESKVAKGDATFGTFKRLLGWDIDSASLTIHLPDHRRAQLELLLDTFLS
jgi:hypothetical protein